MPPATPPLQIRPIAEADEAAWRSLWRGYCDFYETAVPDDVTSATWRRLLDPASPISALAAADGSGRLVGFVHLVLHEMTWSTARACYLEDLFVAPEARGRSAGRGLIDAALAFAAERGCANLYWLTHRENARARRLYDSYVPADGMIRYRLKLPR